MSTESNLRIEIPFAGADLMLVERSLPECPPRGVVIKTICAGICHTDVGLWLDQRRVKNEVISIYGDKVTWPIVLGHEICGRIFAIGNAAPLEPELYIGDKVAVFPWVGCGECDMCKSGRNNVCLGDRLASEIGIGVPGGYQTYVALKEKSYVVKLNEDIPADIACMFGCSALTAFNAVSRAKASIDRAAKCGEPHFLVIGAGGLGLWCIQIARALYPQNTKIFVADIDVKKLQVAKEHGADEGIFWPKDGVEKELIEMTKRITGGIDGSADFVGIPLTCTQSFESANAGATLCVIGLAGGMFPLSTVSLVLKDITLTGIATGTKEEMCNFIALYEKTKLMPPSMIHIQPEEANDTIHKLKEGKIPGRAIINFK